MDRIERIRQAFIPRKVEDTDTQDAIQRHDPDYIKHRENKADDWKDHDEDMTDISVEALIIYLQGLKREQNTIEDDARQKPDPAMKKAISAYTHEEPKSRKRYTYLDDDEAIDIVQVDILIQGLKKLLKDGITHFTLIPAKAFLDSIEKTVEKYSRL